MSDHRTFALQAAVTCVILLAIPLAARTQITDAKKSPSARGQKGGAVSPRVPLTPRFVPGETFRYELEFETTTETARSGLVSDPQGPSRLVVVWNATVRIEVLPPDAGTSGGIRLRTTYEKSSASVRSDTFDPAADQTREQFEKLQGKVVEFTLDATGKVQSVSGLEGIVDDEKAAQSARDWIAQLSASAGAPPKGVSVGETWSSEQPANSLPLAGMVWRTDSQYLRDEPCRPANPNLAPASGPASSAVSSASAETCAVVLANLSLVRPKPIRDPTPPEYRKNGMQTAGVCTGSAQSLVYVSLMSGFVVSVTQTGSEQMDVTLTTSRNASIHYAGTISTRSQVALVVDDVRGQ
jgi:hypothetical protein